MANIFFGRGKKKTLVVESSDMGLRALSLEVTEESITIEKSFFSAWSLFLSQTEDDFTANLDTVMKSLTSYCSPKEYAVVYCCGDSSNWNQWTQTGVIEDEEELEEYLLAKKIMRDQDVWISEASILGPSISEEKECQDVMVQMIRSQVAQIAMDTLEEAGYELEAIEFLPNTFSSFYDYYCEEGRTNTDALISIGWETSVLNIFHENQVRFSYCLNFRLSDYVILIMQKMQLDETSAMQIVYGELFEVVINGSDSQSNIMPQIIDEVRVELNCLIDEIQRAFAFYITKVVEWKIENIERIIFMGIELRIEPIYEYLKSQLRIPTVKIDPMNNVEYSVEAASRIENDNSKDILATSFGLALRYVSS